MVKYNLTYPQKNIWLVEKIYENTPINIISGTVEIEKEFDALACQKAIHQVIKNNEAMRIRIVNQNGVPLQEVLPYEEENIEVVTLSLYSDSEKSEFINDWVLRPLFLSGNGRLYQFVILDYGNDKGAILMKVHHIISDAWSCGKIGTQLISILEQQDDENRECHEEAMPPSYVEYIQSEKEYEQSEKYLKDEAFWQEYLKEVPEPVSIKEKGGKVSHVAKRYSMTLEKELNEKLNNYCKEQRVSPYTVFLAAISIYLYRIQNRKDFILGTPVLNRSNFREKQMIGMFVSTIPIRMKIEENDSFLTLVKKIGMDTMHIFRHQKYPYSKSLEYVRSSSNNKENLYHIVVSYQNAKTLIPNKEKYNTTWKFVGQLSDELQIHVMDMDDTGVLNINYDYITDMFTEEEIHYLHTRVITIIEAAIQDTNACIDDMPIMTQKEEHQILYTFNKTDSEYPREKTVIDLFEEMVKKSPHAIALTYQNRKITYQQFYKAITNFSSKLKNIKNENIIVCMNNSFELIVAIYGILKSGNCYVPIHTHTPIDRIRKIARDCDCQYAVMQDHCLENVTYLDTKYDDSITVNETNYASPSHLAYIIYTSGSTGLPKGVKILNHSLTNYICWAKKTYVDVAIPIMPLYSSIAFDLTVTTLFLPLICGGNIVICQNDNEEIIKIFREDKVNIVKLTPAHLALINEANIRVNNIHTLILGGEALKSVDAKKICKKSKNIRIFNEYGPTETTVGCMVYQYSAKDIEPIVPIGKPSDNTQLYVLNEKQKCCPIGVEGELYIQGEGVSVGYNKMTKKNETCFIRNPYTNRIMYKTGDIVKWDFDHEMKYIGRADKQIKINGNRIELEEIENVAKKMFKFKNVVVDIKEISHIPNICLYYVSENDYNPTYIKTRLKNYLPYYMLPTRYIKVDKIPMSRNGKIKREELPIPQFFKNHNREMIYINSFEKTVCEIWENILGIQSVDPENSIFDYGVDSLNIIRCQVKLSNYTSVVDIQKFYEYPVIRDFCKNLKVIQKQKINELALTKLNDLSFRKVTKKPLHFKNVMLIGATGYLGIHLLMQLLQVEEVENIYCIVRGIDFEKRLKERFEFYFDKVDEMLYNKKVKVINGNIEQKNLGLSDIELAPIIANVDRVINAAAIVKHHGAYSEFEMVNVEAVKNIVDICVKYHLILDHISTISIAGDSAMGEFDETKFYMGQNYCINPYIETKFKAELYIYQMIEKLDLMANVYRIGNLTWRASDGKYQKNIYNNGFFMRMKNILILGKYPSSFKNMQVEMTPVDIAAEFIVSLMDKQRNHLNQIYHIYDPYSVNFIKMVNSLRRVQSSIEEVPDETFIELLKSYDSRENVLLNDIISSIGTINVKITNHFTNEILRKQGKVWPILEDSYINQMHQYLKM